jgi:hypothetical protein
VSRCDCDEVDVDLLLCSNWLHGGLSPRLRLQSVESVEGRYQNGCEAADRDTESTRVSLITLNFSQRRKVGSGGEKSITCRFRLGRSEMPDHVTLPEPIGTATHLIAATFSMLYLA